jgi:hypothetical protein
MSSRRGKMSISSSYIQIWRLFGRLFLLQKALPRIAWSRESSIAVYLLEILCLEFEEIRAMYFI